MKKIIIFLLTGIIAVSLASCTAEQGVQTVADVANSISTADKKEVQQVKNGHLTQYSDTITIGQALDSFLGNPMWQYFTGTNGEKVVQCNGTCMYDNKTVEAKIQFLLHDDDTFEVGAFALNDISQNLLTTATFLNKAYESAGGTATEPANQNKISGSSGSSQTSSTQASSQSQASTSTAAKQESDVEPGDVNPKTQRIGLFSSTEEYLYEYRLDGQVLNGTEIMGLDDISTRQLINALYAYHGYTFETETYRRFFGRMSWYNPRGKSMEACEAEFNDAERTNKELLVDYEKQNGWR